MSQLSNRVFNKYCNLVYVETGIKLTENKRQLLNARISKRIRHLGIEADKYLELIQESPDEKILFLDAISTNHTFFFRESRSYKFLENGCRHIWCAASSSGEEPYSLVTYCAELGFWPSILATDISSQCLEKGRNGVYPAQSMDNIPRQILRRYFQKGCGKWEGYIRVKPEVRKAVTFQRFNLLTDRPPDQNFDAIFCRNVMIYFDAPTKETVVEKLCTRLKPGGYFIIGGAESLSGLTHGLKYIEPSVYQKA